jgi:prophage regulatory protein
MDHGTRAFKKLTDDYHLRAYSTVYALTVQSPRMLVCREHRCAIILFPVYISIGKRKMHTIHTPHHPSASTAQNFDPAITLIRMPDLEAITGLARPTVYKRLKDDPTFPRPVPLSNSKSRGSPVGFVLAEVQAWVRQRIALRGEAA